MRHLGDAERRTRLARRHAVAPQQRVPDPLAATRAMTVLHATEPATVHLSLHAVQAVHDLAEFGGIHVHRGSLPRLTKGTTLYPQGYIPLSAVTASHRSPS